MTRDIVLRKPKHKNGVAAAKRKENLTGWLFVAPLVIGLLLFLAFPLGYAIALSFTDAKSTFEGANFVGFSNYAFVLSDASFSQGTINVLISCLCVPIGLLIATIITNLLVSNPKFSIVFKSIYYIPTICGAVAISFIWQSMYAPMFGVINQFLKAIGAIQEDIAFISEDYFLLSMAIMGVWSGLGTSVLLLFASLKAVSKQLYEAAAIDGANFFQKFVHITLPALSPTLFYVLVTGISGTLQEYTKFKSMASAVGSPMWAMTPAWWIYDLHENYAGRAAAGGVILGIFILIFSALQFVGSKLWVNYDS